MCIIHANQNAWCSYRRGQERSTGSLCNQCLCRPQYSNYLFGTCCIICCVHFQPINYGLNSHRSVLKSWIVFIQSECGRTSQLPLGIREGSSGQGFILAKTGSYCTIVNKSICNVDIEVMSFIYCYVMSYFTPCTCFVNKPWAVTKTSETLAAMPLVLLLTLIVPVVCAFYSKVI